jgi:DNA-binding XRE family transcriptional regulator
VALGLTQEKLAELVDLNIRTVQKIEAGDINVLVTTAIRLKQALGVAWTKLLP